MCDRDTEAKAEAARGSCGGTEGRPGGPRVAGPPRKACAWQTVSRPARRRRRSQHILRIPKCIINTHFTKAICVLKCNICKHFYKSLGLTLVSRRGFWGNGIVRVRVFLIMQKYV